VASPYRLAIALTELAHAERAALRAQDKLTKLTAAGAATDADRAAFLALATQLYAIETGIYGQIVSAIQTLPDEVSRPALARVPAPVQLSMPDPDPTKNPAIPVWALVVIIIVVSIVVIAAVVWVIEVSVEVVASIILTYKQADVYADALQRRIECINRCTAGGQPLAACTTSCNSAIVLPPPPTPPTPASPPNPNLPWYIGGTIVGGLGALGIVAFFLERRAKK
jgi:hypothetical protein